MIARYEETRELRLMGGYTAGADPILDKAIKSVPRIYEAMSQTMDAPRCEDPFIDLAAALRNEAQNRRGLRTAMAPAHEIAIRAVGTALAGTFHRVRRVHARLWRRGRRASMAWSIWRSSPSRAAPGGAVRGAHAAAGGRRACCRHGRDRFARGFRRPSRAERAAGRDRRRRSRSRLAEDRRRDPHGRARRQRARASAKSGRSSRETAAGSCSTTRARSFLPSSKAANGASLFTRKRIFE